MKADFIHGHLCIIIIGYNDQKVVVCEGLY